MFEKDLEKNLVRKIENLGGQALKFNSTKSGMPDRIILLPGGCFLFVEMKRPGEKPRPLQEKRIREIEHLGFQVEVIDSLESLENLMSRIKRSDAIV